MKINWVNCIFTCLIVGLLSWLLWKLGEDSTQKWLLAILGGVYMEIGILGATGITYKNPRSGVQVRILSLINFCLIFLISLIYSFFNFSVEGYCIPVTIIFLVFLLISLKIYNSKE